MSFACQLSAGLCYYKWDELGKMLTLNLDLHFHSWMPTKVMVSNRTSFNLPGQKIKLKETREVRVKLR
jgi:hypothetical protein